MFARIHLFIFVLLVVSKAYGDQNNLLTAIRQPTLWQYRNLPGTWSTVSAAPKILSSKDSSPIFGFSPKRIFVYWNGSLISQAVIVYAEMGYNLNLWNKVEDAQLTAYNAAFDQLKIDLPKQLEKFSGKAGQNVQLAADGAKNFVFNVLEYSNQGLTLRLYVEDRKAISLLISRSQDASTNLLTIESPENRRAALLKNVERKPNGDVLLKNLPVIDQDGRPYCGPATWTEISRYYGLNLYQEMMLSGGREGGEGVKNAAQISQTFDKNFDFNRVQKSIDTGNPIWFSEPGHVALITGYNKNLRKVFRTDSWGEGSRNKSVPLDVFSKEADGFIYFEP